MYIYLNVCVLVLIALHCIALGYRRKARLPYSTHIAFTSRVFNLICSGRLFVICVCCYLIVVPKSLGIYVLDIIRQWIILSLFGLSPQGEIQKDEELFIVVFICNLHECTPVMTLVLLFTCGDLGCMVYP